MSSIYVAKALSTPTKFAGRNWHYDFRELPVIFGEDVCKNNVDSISKQYSKITKCWATDTNSEWICRIYFAAKMVLNATL